MVDNLTNNGDEPRRHLVDVNDLPTQALSAILRKLSERTQKSSQVFMDDYNVSISDLENLIDKIRQEFLGHECLSESLSVSLHLSNNQRFDFTSWPEFRAFDSSQAERTKSLSFEYTRDLAATDGSLERYKVQVACQNIARRFNLYLGPITLSRIEYAGLPPVPIHVSVSYSNYIRGKNLIGTIENWVKALDIDDQKKIKFLQRKSRSFPYLGKVLATTSAIFGCLSFIPTSSDSIEDLGKFIAYSTFFIYISSVIGRALGSFLEVKIDCQRSKSMVSLTKGDKKFDNQVIKKNNKSMRNAVFGAIGLLVQISCGLFASYFYDYFKF